MTRELVRLLDQGDDRWEVSAHLPAAANGKVALQIREALVDRRSDPAAFFVESLHVDGTAGLGARTTLAHAKRITSCGQVHTIARHNPCSSSAAQVASGISGFLTPSG